MPNFEWSQEQFFASFPLALCACDRQGVITQYNRRAVELWGNSPRAGSSRYSEFVSLYSNAGTVIGANSVPMIQVLSSGIAQHNREVIVVRVDGLRIPVLSNIAPLEDEGGNLIGAVDVFQDISDRKRSEEARRVAERLAASARTASEIAQEIETPLYSINDLLERLRHDTSLSMEARYYAESAQQELSRISRIARDTLGLVGVAA